MNDNNSIEKQGDIMTKEKFLVYHQRFLELLKEFKNSGMSIKEIYKMLKTEEMKLKAQIGEG